MRPNNVIVLFLAIVMGGIAAFLARNWIESHSRAYAAGDSAGTIVVAAQPYPGAQIEEDQHFLLRLNGTVDPASVRTSVWCEVDGLLDRGSALGAVLFVGGLVDEVEHRLRQRALAELRE